MHFLPFGLPPVVVAGVALIAVAIFGPGLLSVVKKVWPKKAAAISDAPKSTEEIASGLVEVMVKAKAENDIELLNAAFSTLRALIRVPEVKS